MSRSLPVGPPYYSRLESWGQSYLADTALRQLLEDVDGEFAEKVRRGGCLFCKVGVLHQANYSRKPRPSAKGDNSVALRRSFCCNQDGCRRRHTPPSVRFLGRKVYGAPVVVLVSAIRHGLTPRRLQVLRESLGVDRRTVERWREWWLQQFARSPFWRAARAQFSPVPAPDTLPQYFWQVFGGPRRDRLLKVLKFLSPITTVSIPLSGSA